MDSGDEKRRKVEQLWQSCADAVRSYAVFRVGRDDADDVTMETFVVVWRRISEVPDKPLPWLLGVARNVIRNLDRGARRQADLRTRLREAAEVAGVGEDELAVGTFEVLQGLTPADQELLQATAWYGLTAKEGGQMFGCTPATFAVRLHRARKCAQRALTQASDSRVATQSQKQLPHEEV